MQNKVSFGTNKFSSGIVNYFHVELWVVAACNRPLHNIDMTRTPSCQ